MFKVVDGAEIRGIVSEADIQLLSSVGEPSLNRIESERRGEPTAALPSSGIPDTAGRAVGAQDGATAGESSRGRRRPRDHEGGAGTEQDNGNESDMDLTLLVESESESEDDGHVVVPPDGRASRAARVFEDRPRPLGDVCVVSRRDLYSDEESSSADEDLEENEEDEIEEEEDLEEEEEEEEEEGRDQNENGTRSVEARARAGKTKGKWINV